MGDFNPDTTLYGRPVDEINDRGEVVRRLGTLEEIKGPFLFVVDGKEYEVSDSYDFHVEDDGTISLFRPI